MTDDDLTELRRLHAQAVRAPSGPSAHAIVDALPGLLAEVERHRPGNGPCGVPHPGCADNLDPGHCHCVDTQPHRTHACPCGCRWDTPDEPGDDDFPTTAAVLDSLEDIEQFHDDADMQTAAGVARLALIGYRDRYAELLAEVERLRAAAPASEAVRALFDAVAETVERIAPSNGGDPLPLSEEDATALILWTYQVLRDDLRAGSSRRWRAASTSSSRFLRGTAVEVRAT